MLESRKQNTIMETSILYAFSFVYLFFVIRVYLLSYQVGRKKGVSFPLKDPLTKFEKKWLKRKKMLRFLHILFCILVIGQALLQKYTFESERQVLGGYIIIAIAITLYSLTVYWRLCRGERNKLRT
jgi:hypothetical protein